MKGANYVPASTLPELSADSDAGKLGKSSNYLLDILYYYLLQQWIIC